MTKHEEHLREENKRLEARVYRLETMVANLRGAIEDANKLIAEREQKIEIQAEDLRVTNESADFHMKECQRLREELQSAEDGFREIKELLDDIRSDAQERDTLT